MKTISNLSIPLVFAALASVSLSGQVVSAGMTFPIEIRLEGYEYRYEQGYNMAVYTNHEGRSFVYSADVQYLRSNYDHKTVENVTVSREDWIFGATVHYQFRIRDEFRILPGFGLIAAHKSLVYPKNTVSPEAGTAERKEWYGNASASLNFEYYFNTRWMVSPYVQMLFWNENLANFYTNKEVTFFTSIRVGYSFDR